MKKISVKKLRSLVKEASEQDLMLHRKTLDPVSRNNASKFLKAMGMLEGGCSAPQPVLDAIAVSQEMPCPYKTAEMVKASGASPEEIMGWLGNFLSKLSSDGSTSQENFPVETITDYADF